VLNEALYVLVSWYLISTNKQEFSLRGVKSKKISSHPGKDLLKSVLKARNV